LIPALLAEDAALAAECLPAAAKQRIAERMAREIEGVRRPRPWLPMLSFVAGAVLVLLVVMRGMPPAAAPARASVAPGWSVQGNDCRVHTDAAVDLEGRCELVSADPPLSLRTEDPTRVRVRGRWIDVEDGRATFDVQPVHGEPVRIGVPGGTIVVVGTRFRVDVDMQGRSGSVELFEGELRFEHAEGGLEAIHAGQRFDFAGAPGEPAVSVAVHEPSSPAPVSEEAIPIPLATPEPPAAAAPEVAVAPTLAAPEPTPQRPRVRTPKARRPRDEAPSPVDIASLTEKIDELRRRGEYRDAAEQLERALSRRLDHRTGEVLSYELGTILARHLGDPARACRHWARHVERFDGGRYAAQIERSRATLDCE
jgi:hypothetical protein